MTITTWTRKDNAWKQARHKRLLRIWQLTINLERRYGLAVEHITRNPLLDWILFGKHANQTEDVTHGTGTHGTRRTRN